MQENLELREQLRLLERRLAALTRTHRTPRRGRDAIDDETDDLQLLRSFHDGRRTSSGRDQSH